MLPQMKQSVAIAPTSVTNGATATGVIDTVGFDFVTVDVIATTADVVSNKPSVLKLQESDDTVATNFADIPQFVGGGGSGFTIPNAVTAATTVPGNAYKFNVDARARKRYLRLVVTPQTTMTVTAIANLGRAEQSPTTAAKANVLALAEG